MIESKEYEAVIIKQVKTEVNLWFELEDEVEHVTIHEPKLVRAEGEKFIYRVIVEFFSNRTHESEVGMINVMVDGFGANVTNEKRTDGGWK